MNRSTPESIPFVLTSKDPSFSSLLEHLCHDSSLRLQTTAGPSITLETIRNHSPAFVLLDLDSMDPVETSRLILKITLVSSIPVFLTGTEAIPGHSILDSLFIAGATGCLLKPAGKTSLCLASETGTLFRDKLFALASESRERSVR
jgi:hypothetical protein